MTIPQTVLDHVNAVFTSSALVHDQNDVMSRNDMFGHVLDSLHSYRFIQHHASITGAYTETGRGDPALRFLLDLIRDACEDIKAVYLLNREFYRDDGDWNYPSTLDGSAFDQAS